MKMRNRLIILAAFLIGATAAKAETTDVKELERPVIGYYNFEIGRKSVVSTYVSPLKYEGTNMALSGYWTKSLPVNPEHLAMSFEGNVNLGCYLNEAKTAREMDLHAFVSWGLEWQKRLPNRFIIGGGGVVGLGGGAFYLTRNGNNPVSADFTFGLGLTASAGWHTTIGRLPILINDRARIPLVNGFFMPQYGETYYEIYLGDRRGLTHAGWWGNHFALDNLLSVSFDFGKTAMQIGYRFSMQSTTANHLVTNTFNNAFVIGVVPGGLGLKKKRHDIITPLY